MKHLIFILLLSSCITEDPKGPDSPVEYLNGDKYSAKSNVNIGPIPLTTSIKRKSKDTSLRGCVSVKGSSDLYSPPLKVEKLTLVQADKVIKEQSTDEKGCFNFVGEFEDGDYIIKIKSSRYEGNKSVLVKGYLVEKIDFVATRI